MKKTLVAIAAMSAIGAFAQSSVTLSGTFDSSIVTKNTTFGNNASVSNTAVGNGTQGTSAIIFTGVEDLGGGLKATFRYEGDFTTATQAGPANSIGFGGGDVFVGLEGGWGAVKLGTPNTPSLSVQTTRNGFGSKIGGGFGGVSGTSHVRENGSIRYDSPNFGGFSAAVYYTLGSSAVAAANGGPTAEVKAKTDIGLFYNNGPIAAGLSFYNQDGVNSQTNLSASYDLGVAKVYAGYHTEDKKSGGMSRGYNLAANFTVSPSLVVYGNYGILDDESTLNADKRIAALGAKYSLSKRTSTYARYINEQNDNVNAGASIRSANTFLVGVSHSF